MIKHASSRNVSVSSPQTVNQVKNGVHGVHSKVTAARLVVIGRRDAYTRILGQYLRRLFLDPLGLSGENRCDDLALTRLT
jgi:hypothetical protein